MSMAICAVTALLCVLSPTLRADSITLTLASVSGSPGSTVDVLGTITNISGSTIYLNGDNFSLSDPSLSLDDTNFFLNAPLSLAAGASSGPFDIFAVSISLSASSGDLGPNFFSILGGADSSSSDTIGGAQFDVNVQSTTPVPEPASGLSVIVGFIFLVATQRKEIERFVQTNW